MKGLHAIKGFFPSSVFFLELKKLKGDKGNQTKIKANSWMKNAWPLETKSASKSHARWD